MANESSVQCSLKSSLEQSIQIKQSHSSQMINCINYNAEINNETSCDDRNENLYVYSMCNTALQPYTFSEFDDVVKSIFAPLKPLYAKEKASQDLLKLNFDTYPEFPSKLPLKDVICYVVENTQRFPPQKKCRCREKTPDNKCVLHKNNIFDKKEQTNAENPTDLNQLLDSVQTHDDKTLENCICEPCDGQKKQGQTVEPPTYGETAYTEIQNNEDTSKTNKGPSTKIPTTKTNCSCVNDLSSSTQYFSIQQEPTLSSLELAVKAAQDKCKEKDRIIDMISEELSKKANFTAFESILHNIAQGKRNVPDYSIALLEIGQIGSSIQCPCEESGRLEGGCICNTDPTPLKIINLQRLTNTMLLVKWIQASDPKVTGYEIYLNGIMVNLLSTDRSYAVISNQTKDQVLQVSIYAVTMSGRCYPEAVAIAK